MTRGERIRLLRVTKMSQDALALFSGFSRPEISNVELDKTKWASDRLWRGMQRAFGLNREQLEDFLDERTSVDDAVEISQPHVAALMAREQEYKRRAATARARAYRCLLLAGLAADEFKDELLWLLERLARRRDIGDAAMVSTAAAMRIALAKWMEPPPSKAD